jgi:hypothetical protein
MKIKSLCRFFLLAALFFIVLGAFLYYWVKDQTRTVERDPADVTRYFEQTAKTPAFAPPTREPCSEQNPLKNAYFGELHVHTSFSGDAAGRGVMATPDQAYAYAKGKPLALQLRQDKTDEVPVIQLQRPLDFVAVTDHAEYLGEVNFCLNPDNHYYQSAICHIFRGNFSLPFVDESLRPHMSMGAFVLFRERSASLCGEDGFDCLARADKIWEATQRAAENAYDRSSNCQFTSFVGYEYSLSRKGTNLHRNVIFKNATVPPSPLSAKEANTPELLWEWLQRTCLDSEENCDALAIPHNSNWSSGQMFHPYSLQSMKEEEKRYYSELRHRIEPLAEIMQVKGDSECRNGFAGILGGADEYCDFEKLRPPEDPVEDCGDEVGQGGMRLQGCMSRFSFVRYAQIQGLQEQKLLGVNSLKFGVVAATDNHTGSASQVKESTFSGSIVLDREAEARMQDPLDMKAVRMPDRSRYNPGGIAGIWATQNNREALFEAMQRRETFGTSGPRITPRFFAGWDFGAELCDDQNMIDKAYAGGVPMGGDLTATPESGATPKFLLQASMDNASGATPLQKLQIIKGWIDEDGTQHQKIIDVAGDRTPTVSVDTDDCSQSGTGHSQLCTVWQDDTFDPTQSAVYYARVIENPSCRWSTYDCNAIDEDKRPATCSDPKLPKTIQERAWTSPIWYTGDPQ